MLSIEAIRLARAFYREISLRLLFGRKNEGEALITTDPYRPLVGDMTPNDPPYQEDLRKKKRKKENVGGQLEPLTLAGAAAHART